MGLVEREYYLGFQVCSGVGPRTFAKVLDVFGTAEQAWKASAVRWRGLGLGKQVVEEFLKHREEFDFGEFGRELGRLEVRYVARGEAFFPELLKEVVDCPIGLFVKGRLEEVSSWSVAVVGTRRMTPYGREVTTRLVKGLVAEGLTIVSGMAYGVDGTAHRAALGAGGRTVAVLAGGLDMVYPRQHVGLAGEIVASGGALVSEYPPGCAARPGNFVARNRIVSGMSRGVLVTEGASKSGSKITAMMAVDQNREVFAVPGPITHEMSAAPVDLIKMGAKVVVTAADVIEELGERPEGEGMEKMDPRSGEENGISLTERDGIEKGTIEEKILVLLREGSRNSDELVQETGVSAAEMSTALTMLELEGVLRQLGDGAWMAV